MKFRDFQNNVWAPSLPYTWALWSAVSQKCHHYAQCQGHQQSGSYKTKKYQNRLLHVKGKFLFTELTKTTKILYPSPNLLRKWVRYLGKNKMKWLLLHVIFFSAKERGVICCGKKVVRSLLEERGIICCGIKNCWLALLLGKPLTTVHLTLPIGFTITLLILYLILNLAALFSCSISAVRTSFCSGAKHHRLRFMACSNT